MDIAAALAIAARTLDESAGERLRPVAASIAARRDAAPSGRPRRPRSKPELVDDSANAAVLKAARSHVRRTLGLLGLVI